MGKTAVDAPRINAFLIEPERLTLITDEKHPRYDARVKLPLSEELVASMMAHGYRGGQAITCTKDGEVLEVIDGRQRARAAVEANKRLVKLHLTPIRVKVMLERGDPADLYGVQLICNANRQEDTDLERAQRLHRYMAFGRTEEEAGLLYGLKAPQVKRLLGLLDLAPEVKHAAEEGKISTSAALHLGKLERADQVAAVAEAVTEAGGKRVRVAAMKKKVKAKKSEKSPALKLKGAALEEADPPSPKAIRALLKEARCRWEKGGTGERAADLGIVIDTLEWVTLGRRPTLGPVAALLGCEAE